MVKFCYSNKYSKNHNIKITLPQSFFNLDNSRQQFITTTQNWVKDFVLKLNLCPFAHVPFKEDKIRYTLADQATLEEQMIHYWKEIELIEKLGRAEISNTLIIFPNSLQTFDEYLGFLDLANELLEKQNMDNQFQLASFHPDYLFGDSPPDDVKHHTNRSPFPMIHILRVDEVEEAIEMHPDTDKIPDTNRETLLHFFLKKKN